MDTAKKPLFQPPTRQPLSNQDLLSWMLDSPQYSVDKPIYVDASNPSRFLTYTTALSLIRRLAAGFRAAGVKPGDCVLIHSFNNLYYPALVLGIIAAGGVFTGTNPSYTATELSHHIRTAKASYIIAEPEILQAIIPAAEDVGIPSSKIWIFDTTQESIPAGKQSWKDLLNHGEEDWHRSRRGSDAACRLFSSGTTGLPKATNISHLNLIMQHMGNNEYLPRGYDDPVFILPLPMFHVAAVPLTHTTMLRGGYTAYILRRFELSLYFSTITNHGVTELGTVPPLVLAMVNFLESPAASSKQYSLSSVRSVSCGAAPLGKELQGRFKTHLPPGARFTQVWGMTEATCVVTRFWHPEDDDTGSVGRLMPNFEAKVVDDAGKDISAYNVTGEICIRGPCVVNGYFENPKATKETFDDDGFYHTGDIGFCDGESGKWYIVDRKKELIKVRGFQVAPPELEAVLIGHPEVLDAAVIGIPVGGIDGEHPRAYVTTKLPRTVSEQELQEWVAQRVAKYKRLEGGVRFVEAIPKNASGKILKREIREWVKREAAEGKVGTSKL